MGIFIVIHYHEPLRQIGWYRSATLYVYTHAASSHIHLAHSYNLWELFVCTKVHCTVVQLVHFTLLILVRIFAYVHFMFTNTHTHTAAVCCGHSDHVISIKLYVAIYCQTFILC